MQNTDYLDSIHVSGEARERCLAAMEKYGENHWWEPMVDDRTFAYYQFKEPLYLDGSGNGGRLGRGLMALLGRAVLPDETILNKAALQSEVDRAWADLHSDQGRESK